MHGKSQRKAWPGVARHAQERSCPSPTELRLSLSAPILASFSSSSPPPPPPFSCFMPSHDKVLANHRASLESASPQNFCDDLNAMGDNQLPPDSHSAWKLHASAHSIHCGSQLAADCYLMHSSGHKKYCSP